MCNSRHFTFARDLSRGLGGYPAFLGFSEHQASLLGGQTNLEGRGVIQLCQVQTHAVAKQLPHMGYKPSGRTTFWNSEVSRKGFACTHICPFIRL